MYIRLARAIAVSVLVAAALSAAALAFATPASAATPCWKQILSEWTDTGRVSPDYELHCYNEALSHVPEDLAVYTDIEQDIFNARQLAARGVRTVQSHQPPSSSDRITSSPNNGLYNQALDKIGPTNADSMPLPLLILAGLSLILISAGGAGLVTRRVRARKVPS